MSERKIIVSAGTAIGYRPTPLQVTIYGMRLFSLVDADGHMPSFGQDEVESRQ